MTRRLPTRRLPIRRLSIRRLPGLAATVLAAALLAPAVGAEMAIFDIDTAHSGVNFAVRHFVTMVPGQFEDFSGTVRYDPERPEETAISFTIQAASIDTRSAERDDHLRSEDFFHTAEHPTLSFESVSARRLDDDTLAVTGDLTIRGVTKRITVPVDVLGVMPTPMGTRGGFATEFTIDRQDFGVTWNRALEGGGVVLGDDVEIAISVAAVRREPVPGRG